MRDPAFWWRDAGLAASLLAPLGKVYGMIAAQRMAKPGTHAGLPVICVGNFTLGGAGKTPTAMMLVKLLREAGDRAFAVLRMAAEKLVALMPAQARPPALMVALHVWATTHGIASLFSRGDAARRALPMPPEELLEAAVLIYLRGLGLPEGAAPRGG